MWCPDITCSSIKPKVKYPIKVTIDVEIGDLDTLAKMQEIHEKLESADDENDYIPAEEQILLSLLRGILETV